LSGLFEALNRGDLDALEELVAEDCVDHDPIPGQPPGLSGVRLKIALYRAAMPDATSSLDAFTAEPGGVLVTWTTRWTARGAPPPPPLGGGQEAARPRAHRFTARFGIEGGKVLESAVLNHSPVPVEERLDADAGAGGPVSCAAQPPRAGLRGTVHGMTSSDGDDGPIEGRAAGDIEVRDIDEGVLADLESKFADVRCPVHGGPPAFDVAPDGSVVEHMCCETLLSIVRELQIAAGERPAPPQ
jgi:hypothetical protein